ncbi:unnamed protein product [Boreogadus saida]
MHPGGLAGLIGRGERRLRKGIRDASSGQAPPVLWSPAGRVPRMGCGPGRPACQAPSQAAAAAAAGSAPAPYPEPGASRGPDALSSLERLSQATGGMEKSWYRCVFPFGVISLVIGVAGTGVTYAYNDLPQTKVASLVLLGGGLLLVLLAATCWTVHRRKKRRRKEEGGGGGGSFTSEQCPL